MNIGPFNLNPFADAINAAANEAGQQLQAAADNAWQAAGQAAEAVAGVVEDGVVFAGQVGGAVAGFAGWVAGTAGGQFMDQIQMGPELIDLRRRAMEANQGEPAERRHDTPDEAREFRDLSMAIYDSNNALPEGYEEVPNAEEELGIPLTDPETGLEAKVYRKGDTYVLVFEGSTNGDNGTDWGANFANGGGGVPEQYRQALDIGLRFKEVYGSQGDVVVTGHSLGGGLATFAGLGAGIETYTYNASGLGPGTRMFLDSALLTFRNEHLIKNYVQRGEILNIIRTAQTVLMTGPFSGFFGSLILIGETERVGEYGSDPVTAHNNPDLSEV